MTCLLWHKSPLDHGCMLFSILARDISPSRACFIRCGTCASMRSQMHIQRSPSHMNDKPGNLGIATSSGLLSTTDSIQVADLNFSTIVLSFVVQWTAETSFKKCKNQQSLMCRLLCTSRTEDLLKPLVHLLAFHDYRLVIQSSCCFG